MGPDRPLLVVPKWIEAHCVIPDRSHSGLPFNLPSEQLNFVANHYRVRGSARFNPEAEIDPRLPQNPKADAFVFRRSQLVRAQKWGKSPLISAFTCAEGVGPVLFGGFAGRGPSKGPATSADSLVIRVSTTVDALSICPVGSG